MKITEFFFKTVIGGCLLALAACGQQEQESAAVAEPVAGTPPAAGVAIDQDDIGGVVTSANGPEAGVWVIAETGDLPTLFSRSVVTDDNGRYVIPDLPAAQYEVWVRGYGLVDSPRVGASPGQSLDLEAVIAPDAAAAAAYYPAGHWYSLLDIPARSEFPGTGPEGNGISPDVHNQADFIRRVTNGGCLACHQMGNAAIRNMPSLFSGYDTSEEAWNRRIMSGQAGGSMVRGIAAMGEHAISMYADWTDRIAAGELPPAPERPAGLERNVVITIWDWADPTAYLHDLVSTDRRDPTVNGYGRIYGALEESANYLPVLDPATNSISQVPVFPEDPEYNPPPPTPLAESPYWGDEPIWDASTSVHNPMLDHEGRVWITARVRAPDNVPDFCREGSDHPSAQVFPTGRAGRHLGVYDPESDVYTPINTCFSTHHLMFAEDEDHTLWTSGGGSVIGWLNTREYLETGDSVAAQGWTPFILDTNGNGVRDADYTEPGEAADPARDMRIDGRYYGVAPAPDGTIWGSSLGYPGAVVRLVPGDDPATTALTEIYQPPLDANGDPVEGFSPRGMDIDRNGVVWAAMASGHMASFDRSLCTGPLNGPEATGQHCPEGWTFYTEPLPQFRNLDLPGSAEGSYYTWVDQFDTFGLGDNTPINTGNQSGALLVLNDGEWVRLRVPYPLGFYTKWLDGRIDDPDAGWKGRGLWATYSSRAPFHMETGAGTTSKVYHFQMRPDPLAR